MNFCRFARSYTFVAACSFLFSVVSVRAQVGIGTNTPDPSAQLHVESVSKGVLIPRMSLEERDDIKDTATGLLIYQTDNTPGFYYFNGAEWVPVSTPPVAAAPTGFSAVGAGPYSISAPGQIDGWNLPSYDSPSSFNVGTGDYTVPETGLYAISATINYKTVTSVTVNMGPGVDPEFVVRKTMPVTENLVSGKIPVLDVNIMLLLSLRSILGSGCVVLNRVVPLNAGDVLGLFYNPDGLTMNLYLDPDGASGLTWSVMKL